MIEPNSNCLIHEMRVPLTISEYERLIKFYCNGLGIEPAEIWNNWQGQDLVLNMGKAMMEILDEVHAESIDQLEVGRPISSQILFTFDVPDLEATMERLIAHGVKSLHPPIKKPWGDYIVRLQDPDGLQITLFQTVKK
jgi:predicted enzyme related to lactoylglutathione lyase